MGTWGSGNFENDAALDAFGGVVDDLVERLEEAFDAEIYIEDVEGEIALVEVLAVLGEHCARPYLDRTKVVAWAERVLAAYDAQIDGLEPTEDFKRERRAVIERTFGRLLAVLDPAQKPGSTESSNG